AVRGQPAADVSDDVRLAPAAARVLALDVHDVAVVENGHLRREAGPARELAHRGPADLAHRELVQIGVAELRHTEVETPRATVGGRRDEAAPLEYLQEIGHARPGSTQPLGQLPRGQAVLPAVDEE